MRQTLFPDPALVAQSSFRQTCRVLALLFLGFSLFSVPNATLQAIFLVCALGCFYLYCYGMPKRLTSNERLLLCTFGSLLVVDLLLLPLLLTFVDSLRPFLTAFFLSLLLLLTASQLTIALPLVCTHYQNELIAVLRQGACLSTACLKAAVTAGTHLATQIQQTRVAKAHAPFVPVRSRIERDLHAEGVTIDNTEPFYSNVLAIFTELYTRAPKLRYYEALTAFQGYNISYVPHRLSEFAGRSDGLFSIDGSGYSRMDSQGRRFDNSFAFFRFVFLHEQGHHVCGYTNYSHAKGEEKADDYAEQVLGEMKLPMNPTWRQRVVAACAPKILPPTPANSCTASKAQPVFAPPCGPVTQKINGDDP